MLSLHRVHALAFALVVVAPFAGATDISPTVLASVRDNGLDGMGDIFSSPGFEGLLHKGTANNFEVRAMQEFNVAAFTGGVLQSATLSGTIFSNNAFDVGVRTFDFMLYAGNGVGELTDYQIAATVVGSGQYHPPITTMFTYSFDVTATAQALLSGGATWIGLRAVCTSDPNYPNILDDASSKLALVAATSTGTPFCPGDGSGAACPCANESPLGAQVGCLSSLGVGGKLTGSGITSVSNDTFRLDGTNLPNAPGLYFQGTTQTSGGIGAAFGDGLRCVAGTVIRLGTKAAVSGGSHYPDVGDQSVSVRGLIAPSGGTFHYQLWYRNAATFCTPSTFNLTNGLSVTWMP